MGFFSHLLDTIAYIRKYGWHEWRLARQRYDKHMLAEQAKLYKYTKQGEVARVKAMKKQQRK